MCCSELLVRMGCCSSSTQEVLPGGYGGLCEPSAVAAYSEHAYCCPQMLLVGMCGCHAVQGGNSAAVAATCILFTGGVVCYLYVLLYGLKIHNMVA